VIENDDLPVDVLHVRVGDKRRYAADFFAGFHENLAGHGGIKSFCKPRGSQLAVVEPGIRSSGNRFGFLVPQMCSRIRWSYARRGEWTDCIPPASPGRSLAATHDQESKNPCKIRHVASVSAQLSNVLERSWVGRVLT